MSWYNLIKLVPTMYDSTPAESSIAIPNKAMTICAGYIVTTHINNAIRGKPNSIGNSIFI